MNRHTLLALIPVVALSATACKSLDGAGNGGQILEPTNVAKALDVRITALVPIEAPAGRISNIDNLANQHIAEAAKIGARALVNPNALAPYDPSIRNCIVRMEAKGPVSALEADRIAPSTIRATLAGSNPGSYSIFVRVCGNQPYREEPNQTQQALAGSSASPR